MTFISSEQACSRQYIIALLQRTLRNLTPWLSPHVSSSSYESEVEFIMTEFGTVSIVVDRDSKTLIAILTATDNDVIEHKVRRTSPLHAMTPASPELVLGSFCTDPIAGAVPLGELVRKFVSDVVTSLVAACSQKMIEVDMMAHDELMFGDHSEHPESWRLGLMREQVKANNSVQPSRDLTIIVSGRPGSGRTTMIDMLNGFLGSIGINTMLADGNDARELNQANVGRRLARMNILKTGLRQTRVALNSGNVSMNVNVNTQVQRTPPGVHAPIEQGSIEEAFSGPVGLERFRRMLMGGDDD